MRPLLALILPLGWPLLVASSSPEPCALVTEISDESGSSIVKVPAQLAHECLLSIPFRSDLASEFIQEITKHIQWHSTVDALKDPPATYTSSATDILGGLEKIGRTNYASHYEFDTAISNLLSSANDGHLAIFPCTLSIFDFCLEDAGLVSVSTDGIQAPDVYTLSDSLLLNSTVAQVSPIVSINGKQVNAYLEEIAGPLKSRDPDARYNRVFYSLPSLATGNTSPTGAFIDRDGMYPGTDVTTIEFRNGSSIALNTLAILKKSYFSARDGSDVFDDYCLNKQLYPSLKYRSTNTGESKPYIQPPKQSGPSGYPEPLIRDPYSQISGYALDDDTTVMLITTFTTAGGGLPGNQTRVFAETASEIVSTALAKGHTKLIIDVSGNSGGQIDRAFDLFKLFFPSKQPYSATRFRRHEASEGVVKVFGGISKEAAQMNAPLAYAGQVTPDQEAGFESAEEFLSDDIELGGKVSSLYANYNYTSNSIRAIPIRGYGGQPINMTQPFKAENIIIIGDGVCASTCTTFVNLMTNVGGVRTVSFGGRPNGKPMQLMGGVRGAESQSFSGLAQWTSKVLEFLGQSVKPDGSTNFLSKEEIKRLKEVLPQDPGQFPISINGGNVNFRNAYQEGEDDLPLQFQYQASDCRLYYTVENVYRPHTVWKAAKEAIWGAGTCVVGSTGGVGSLEYKSKGNETGVYKSEETGGRAENKTEEDGGITNAAAGIKTDWVGLMLAVAIMAELQR
ncbi:TSPc domain-containing protein [Fusarium keratoplasticum]|uniref:TSPc domain-containing protein n=1 Tax=Fusarium keratoplasticum TaxID=1328300 RepID=A0ACC0QNF9_9HYPO|nr:TSPc domain-containing protein [Fusarium keratoplasticum]KAI8660248.1 TSPc domain-containing protein [Fusarium keratoplasticum]